MKRMMVQYKIKADRVRENEAYIRSVFEQLRNEQPQDLHYASFKLADGLTFVHIVAQELAGEHSPLLALSAFKAFVSSIKDRCDEPPVSVELTEIGSYRAFTD
ncbi:hypothetical protein [Silvimonas amylolytica]|uniref:Uncharacterized protein n=1 Tax=Silvimonas amylolytica TaxID=449663 RepID=A0ABQ2PJY8_9NEIS|nr:hypothetical protein [Silvimonas amylolytica]GGP25304.1 hypothetical protein GCM10010971_11230 [Silvimonas amylolytica]